MISTWIVAAAIAFVMGGVGGWCAREHSQADRVQSAISGAYLAQKECSDKQTELALVELQKYRESIRHRRCDRIDKRGK